MKYDWLSKVYVYFVSHNYYDGIGKLNSLKKKKKKKKIKTIFIQKIEKKKHNIT